MRLFVAIEVAPGVAGAAHALVDTLRARTTTLAPAARITWIPEDRLHLTIAFVGHVTEEQALRIRDVLSPAVPVASFAFAVGGVGAFPPRGAPTVLWAGVADPDGGLTAVETQVSARLASVGFPREARPFRPHLTLARVKVPAGLRTAPLFAGLEDHQLGTTHVEAITLFESHLSPRGPRYVPLQRTGLQ